MAFRSDQWYNLENQGEADALAGSDRVLSRFNRSGQYLVGDNINDPFTYPDRKIRLPGNANDVFLKRGYIRSLAAPENKELPMRRCQFQFNPQFLVQSISQNTSILNFLQQDPAQYAQPIPGNVSFSFELFFDRSMEINNAKPSDAIDLTNPWEKSSPSNVGVLHDIAAFYSVIGVGLSEAIQEYTRTTLERNIRTAINKKVEEAGTVSGEDETFDSATEEADAVAAASDFLKYNVGNTAFLLPLPVRVVFSSLYIVEGLVKDVTVTFTKFNHAMVPMQCTLNVLFEAKYIGFAKKDTFFTQVLEEQAAQELNEYNVTQAELEAYVEDIAADFGKVTVIMTNGKGGALTDDPNDEWGNRDQVKLFDTSPVVNTAYPNAFIGLHNFLSNDPDQEAGTQKRWLKVLFTGEKESGRLRSLFTRDIPLSVSCDAQLQLHRVHNSLLSAPDISIYKNNFVRALNGAVYSYSSSDPETNLTVERGDLLIQKLKEYDSRSLQPGARTNVVTITTGSGTYTAPGYLDMGGAYVSDSSRWKADEGDADRVRGIGITTADTSEKYTQMMFWACVSDEQLWGRDDRMTKQGGSGSEEDLDSLDDWASEFHFIVKVTCTIRVTIDGNTLSATSSDYLTTLNFSNWAGGDNYQGEDAFLMRKDLQFNWPVPEVESTSVSGGGGVTASETRDEINAVVEDANANDDRNAGWELYEYLTGLV